MSQTKSNDFDLDRILVELGQFGKFQIINYMLLCIPVALSAIYGLGYVFTAQDLEYRCAVPGCENTTTISEYNPDWLRNAVPFKDDTPSNCYRYKQNDELCSPESFNISNIIKCTPDELVYKTSQRTIVNDFNLTCSENKWKLALVGTIQNVGQFIGLPLTGYVSDKYGRKTFIVLAIVSKGFLGLIKSFAPNYYLFLAIEILEPILGSGVFSAGFILGMEIVAPKNRVTAGNIISISFTLGLVAMGLISMLTDNWRTLLQISYAPALLVIIHFWTIPESVRWLVAKGKKKEASKIILKAARINKVQLSDECLEMLHVNMPIRKEDDEQMNQLISNAIPEETRKEETFWDVMKNKALLIRLANFAFCYLANNFIYYGLSLSSVSLAGNKNLNFMLAALIEIPAYITTYFVMHKFGRKKSLCGTLILSGAACVSAELVPGSPILKLIFFLVGKFAITISFAVVYIYAAELFPTSLRQSLLGTCSMFGRIGSMIAPQTPLLATYMKSLPLLLFGGTAFTSGILVLSFPETLDLKLPDNINEAVQIGHENDDEENEIGDEKL